jgi:hypothetical protein
MPDGFKCDRSSVDGSQRRATRFPSYLISILRPGIQGLWADHLPSGPFKPATLTAISLSKLRTALKRINNRPIVLTSTT